MNMKIITPALLLFLNCLPFQFLRHEVNCDRVCSNQPRSLICIKKTMDNGGNNLKGIYATELKRNRDIKGNIKIKFLIIGNGRVEKLEAVNSTLNDSIFLRKILSEISLWNFCSDSTGKPVEVIFPFIFETEK
jgi:hypothetical protein